MRSHIGDILLVRLEKYMLTDYEGLSIYIYHALYSFRTQSSMDSNKTHLCIIICRDLSFQEHYLGHAVNVRHRKLEHKNELSAT